MANQLMGGGVHGRIFMVIKVCAIVEEMMLKAKGSKNPGTGRLK